MLRLLAKKGVREILLELEKGSRKFSELAKKVKIGAKRINRRTLNRRLKELEDSGLVVREVTTERPPGTLYKLTESGKEKIELIVKLERQRNV